MNTLKVQEIFDKYNPIGLYRRPYYSVSCIDMYKAGKTEIDIVIADTVKKLRIEKGMSQAVLGIKMGLPSTFISKIENPKLPTKYNIAHLNKLAKIFNCSPRDFLPEKPI